MDGGYGSGAHSHQFMRALGERGWIALTWPREFGGSERPMVDKLVLFEELALAGAPFGPLAGSDQAAQSIIRDGNPTLRAELLPATARGEFLYWQGFSEPDAGSDLLSLRTRAHRDGDTFVINGHKIWSSHAGISSHGMVLARTSDSERRSQGLTMFIVPNDTPGLTLRPITSLTGKVYHYESFLDEVRVPETSVLGTVDEGFRELLRGLDRDRFWGRFYKQGNLRRILHLLKQGASAEAFRHDQTLASRMAALEAEVDATRFLFYRFGWQLDNGHEANYESALYKTLADELGQRVANLGMDVLGLAGLVDGERGSLSSEIRHLYLTAQGQTIAGGTSEVLRNTVATRGLELPRS
jgi:alkylation response protein AidB-like acyl-CoA dehydrogenase